MALIFFLFAVIWCEAVKGNEYENNITIATMLGDVMGVETSNYMVFRGLPFTEQAPIGEYRWKESNVRTSDYTEDDSVYDATSYRSACLQYTDKRYKDQSEDCLYLNIFVPSIAIEEGNASLAVLFWIHGGAFILGSSSTIKGYPLLAQENVVFVSINYRLGPYGFLALESIYNETNGKTTGGMNGINDQIVALKWVQDNIEDFGGDPNRVTIAGQSAGGHSVCILSLLPAAANLFHQAIIESGNCSPPRNDQKTREAAIDLSFGLIMDKLGLYNDSLDELRSFEGSTFKYWTSVRPSVDGYLLTNSTHNMLLNGDFSLNVDKFIIGSNSLDSLALYPWGSSAATKGPKTNDEFESLLAQYTLSSDNVDSIQNTFYPLSDFTGSTYFDEVYSDQTMRWTTINADVCYKCSTLFFINKVLSVSVSTSKDDIYLYNFIGPKPPNYASHAAEFPYLFYEAAGYANFTFFNIEDSKLLSDFMIDLWINFVSNGAPNSSLNAEEWIPFKVNNTAMIIGNDGSRSNESNGYNVDNFDINYKSGVCNFWLNEVGFDVIADLCLQTNTLEPTTAPTNAPVPITSLQTTGSGSGSIPVSSESMESNENNANTFGLQSVVLLFIVYIISIFC